MKTLKRFLTEPRYYKLEADIMGFKFKYVLYVYKLHFELVKRVKKKKYYFLAGTEPCIVFSTFEEEREGDDRRYAMGNYYKTYSYAGMIKEELEMRAMDGRTKWNYLTG